MPTSPASSEHVLNGTAAHVGDQVGSHVGPPGQWLSIEGAAAALGLNPSTVRRHVRDQKLPSRREKRPQGYTLRVFVAESQLADAENDHLGELTAPASSPSSAHLAQLDDPNERAQAMATYSRELL